jgi:hypothetical protein
MTHYVAQVKKSCTYLHLLQRELVHELSNIWEVLAARRCVQTLCVGNPVVVPDHGLAIGQFRFRKANPDRQTYNTVLGKHGIHLQDIRANLERIGKRKRSTLRPKSCIMSARLRENQQARYIPIPPRCPCTSIRRIVGAA